MSNNEDIFKQALLDFRRSVEITRDVRFQANLRLTRRQQGSAYIIALLSLYVIALSLIPNILLLKPFQNQILLASSIVLSVFIIFTSLIDGSQNFYHQGDLLHQCARKIATVHHGLKNIDVNGDISKGSAELQALQAEYRKALGDCPINHDNIDYIREMGWKPHLFPADYPKNKFFAYLTSIWFKVRSSVMGNSWMTGHIIAFAAVSVVVYVFVIKGSTFK